MGGRDVCLYICGCIYVGVRGTCMCRSEADFKTLLQWLLHLFFKSRVFPSNASMVSLSSHFTPATSVSSQAGITVELPFPPNIFMGSGDPNSVLLFA